MLPVYPKQTKSHSRTIFFIHRLSIYLTFACVCVLLLSLFVSLYALISSCWDLITLVVANLTISQQYHHHTITILTTICVFLNSFIYNRNINNLYNIYRKKLLFFGLNVANFFLVGDLYRFI